MSEGYIRQVLWEAVNSLATSAAPLQKRLEWAAISLIKLQREDFENAKKDLALYTAIKDTLTALEPVGEEGSIVATTAAMSDEQAEAVAKQILELHGRYFPL
jgi:hypothetical protein